MEGKAEPITGNFVLPESIRRSHIELYRKCPYSFYWEVVKGVERPDTVYTRLGVDIHDIADEHSNNRSLSLEQLIEAFQCAYHTYTDDLFGDVDKDKMYERGITSIKNYFRITENLPITPFATEQKIHFPIADGLPTVNITMDRIDEVAGELDILDWKTGKVMVGKNLCYDMQAPLYIHAVRTHFKRQVRRFTFHYINENKFRVFERVNDDVYRCTVGKKDYDISISATLREVNTIFSHIKKGMFNVPNDSRGMFFTCKMCHQKAIGNCRGVEEQSWHNAKGEASW